MTRLVGAIDIGVHEVYWSRSMEKVILDAGIIEVKDLRELAFKVGKLVICEDLVIELPQVYTGSKAKGDPNDLIRMATVCGACAAGASSRYKFVSPAQWKGQQTKDVTKNRLLGTSNEIGILTVEERHRVGPHFLRNHNIRDSLAINLWACGRY